MTRTRLTEDLKCNEAAPPQAAHNLQVEPPIAPKSILPCKGGQLCHSRKYFEEIFCQNLRQLWLGLNWSLERNQVTSFASFPLNSINLLQTIGYQYGPLICRYINRPHLEWDLARLYFLFFFSSVLWLISCLSLELDILLAYNANPWSYFKLEV